MSNNNYTLIITFANRDTISYYNMSASKILDVFYSHCGWDILPYIRDFEGIENSHINTLRTNEPSANDGINYIVLEAIDDYIHQHFHQMKIY